MEIKYSKIKIGQIGILDVKLPMITIGQGKPKGVIVSGLHGKETTGLLVIQQLLKYLSNLNGQLIILPVANPFGIINNSRNEPIDGMDLNRIFPGSNTKNFSQRIAGNIFSIIADADFVIDLHSFTRLCPITGILIKNKDNKLNDLQKKMIKALNPEIGYLIDPDKETNQKNALDIECIKQGIPAITIETPKMDIVNNSQINQVTKGIINILNLFGLMENPDIKVDKSENTNIPVYEFKMIYADNAGLFYPTVNPLENVEKGQKIGVLTSIVDFREKDVICSKSGVITTIQPKGLIRTGTKLYTLGKLVEKI